MFKEYLVSYFLSRPYDSIDDLAEKIMNPATYRSYTVMHSIKSNITLLTLNP